MSGAIKKAAFRLPGPLGMVGKRHIQIASSFMPSASVFGATAFTTLCYFTDWRLILDFLPYYNTKFDAPPEF